VLSLLCVLSLLFPFFVEARNGGLGFAVGKWWFGLGLADLGVVVVDLVARLADLGVVVVDSVARLALGLVVCRSRRGGLGLRCRDRPGVVAWAWVSVHGVVVVDSLGLGSPHGGWVFWVSPVGFSGFCRLGFGARRGGWKRVWVWWWSRGSQPGGGGAVPDLGFFFLFNSLVLKLWNLTVWLLRN
jgi:hypothetical protein